MMVALNIHNTPASGKSSWISLEENQRSKCGQGKVGEIVDLSGIKILWDDDATHDYYIDNITHFRKMRGTKRREKIDNGGW